MIVCKLIAAKESVRNVLLRSASGAHLWKSLGTLKRQMGLDVSRGDAASLADGTHPPRSSKPFGVNLIGYLRSEHGIGEACRHVAEALEASGIPWSAYDWEMKNVSRKNDGRWQHRVRTDFPYAVSVFHINADQLPLARRYLPQEAWNTYRIGIWYWEMPEFPEEWKGSFSLLDEIWAPTGFIADSLRKVATCPVHLMPPPMSLEMPADVSRARFGLPENRLLFLTMFDTMSEIGRKNPHAAIRAFQRAFRPDDTRAGLVVKVNNACMSARDVAALEELCGAYANIYFVKETLDRLEVNRLLQACDVICSLHRSEGLGLLCQEAMCLGKPVIATRWSGNLDFMNDDNSCLVECAVVELKQDCGPYRKGMHWAEVSIDAAASLMRVLATDEAFRHRIGKMAKIAIENAYSVRECGLRLRSRLEQLNTEGLLTRQVSCV